MKGPSEKPDPSLRRLVGYDTIAPHLEMLRDQIRTDSYRLAIEHVVEPRDRVLDFGCGTGILSLFASRAGAERVYAVDRSGMIAAAEKIAEINGIGNIDFYFTDGAHLELPGKVDVIVSEWMGSFVLTESMLRPLLALRNRFLGAGGRMIPRKVRLLGGLVTTSRFFEKSSFLRTRPYGFDFSPIEDWPIFQLDRGLLSSEDVLSKSVVLREMDMLVEDGRTSTQSGTLIPDRSAWTYGLCGWFEAELAPGVILRTGPMDPPTHWKQVLFPFSKPLLVRAEEPVRIAIEHLPPSKGRPGTWKWEVRTNEESVGADTLTYDVWMSRLIAGFLASHG